MNNLDSLRRHAAERATAIGFGVNLLLSCVKIVTGICGRSSAMLADGIHSLSDFVTDAIVIVFIRLSSHDSDPEHTYGHGKFETMASLMVSVVLMGVGVGVFYDSVMSIVSAVSGEVLPAPHSAALWVALVSIACKELLYRYTVAVGKRICSPVVVANAWHHRSDALSSIGAALGIGCALFLGEGWRVLDPVAGLVVSMFIAKVGFDLAKPCVDELLEAALPHEVCDTIVGLIMQNGKVKSYHKLRTRRIGSAIAIDVHVQLSSKLTFVEAHNVTHEIEVALRGYFGQKVFVNIHAEPVDDAN